MLTRLLILWLLSERPHHGYSIRKILGDAGLGFWFPIEDAAIYSMLRSLVKAGFARKLRKEREGRRPRRTPFEITPQGREHYAELLRRAWRNVASAPDPVQLALAAQGDLPDVEVLELAHERAAALAARADRMRDLKQAAPAGAMADREIARIEAEQAWIQRWLRKEGRHGQ